MPHLLIDEVPSVRRLQSIDDLFISGGRVPIEQVVLDTRVEQDGFLTDIADLPAEFPQVEVFDLPTV